MSNRELFKNWFLKSIQPNHLWRILITMGALVTRKIKFCSNLLLLRIKLLSLLMDFSWNHYLLLINGLRNICSFILENFSTEFMNLFLFFIFFHLFWMFELPQSWMLFIRKWRNQNKSLYRPKNARLRCLVNCLKQNESVYFLSSSRLNKKNEVWKSDFQKLLCPRLPLNRFSKAICQNVHEILDKKISHGQLCASIFNFLILRVNKNAHFFKKKN